MQQDGFMSYKLTDLLNDCRLDRLLSSESRCCALQLWVLQLQYENVVENRLIYGRLLPYSFSNNCWSFSDKDNSQSFGSFRACVTQLNLYVDSSLCRDLLQKACDGQSIDKISKDLNLTLPEKLSKQYGNTTLIGENAIFRPVTYLLNRAAHVLDSLVSPHGNAGALSASISQSDKLSLFFCGENYNTDVTSMIVSRLNTDTGMDFGKTDINRLGDLELLVFPALDDNERNLLTVNWCKDKGLSVQFSPTQLPIFNSFHFHLSIENNNQVLCSRVAVAQAIDGGRFEYNFKLDEQLFETADSTRVDIFGFKTDSYDEGCLCCNWRINYIRELNLQMSFIGNKSNPVKFDWLEKTTSSKMTDRVSQALSFSTRSSISESRIKGRNIDSWVPVNQALKSLFTKLYPPQSDGRFFSRWGQSNGEGRLQFVEWFKGLIEKHHQQHIAIFDPYFEDVGLSLLTLYASPDAEYTIFRTIPKPRDEDTPRRRKKDNLVNEGIDNLIANCEHNRKLLQRSKVKVYGLKEGRLHDRYILVIGQNGLPVEGFHLSNSFQKAAENYPLLITPIPTDVLYKTNQYTFDLVQEANNPSSEKDETNSVSVLFDSKSSPVQTKQYEPLSILKNELAGTILSIWLKQPLLKGLYGNELKHKMVELGNLQNESLHSLPKEGLFNCLDEMEGELSDFMMTWDIIGDVLAHTPAGDANVDKLQFETKFLTFLSDFLSCSFQRKPICDEKEVTVIAPSYFKKTLKEFLQSSTQVHHFFQSTKYKILTWAEFYAIKYLWRYAPESLIALVDREVKCLAIEFQQTDTVRLSLLGQVVSEISICSEFGAISERQQKQLLESEIVLMNWLGWNTLERQLQSPNEPELTLKGLSNFSYTEKLQFIGWAIHRSARHSNNRKLYESLIVELNETLPEKIPYPDFELLIESARGHMRQLGWAEPWLFSDIVQPLLNHERVDYEDVCKVWFQDLIELLTKENKHGSIMFSAEREGQTTNFSAYLWTHSGPNYQKKCITKIRRILDKQKRIIQQPLASTSNWSRWDEALKVSLWILVFTKFCKYYLNSLNVSVHEQLNLLLEDASSLAMTRPSNEWLPDSEMFLYFKKIEEQLSNPGRDNEVGQL